MRRRRLKESGGAIKPVEKKCVTQEEEEEEEPQAPRTVALEHGYQILIRAALPGGDPIFISDLRMTTAPSGWTEVASKATECH